LPVVRLPHFHPAVPEYFLKLALSYDYMQKYNILILGNGGREHAMAAHFANCASCAELYIAPGNPGTSALGTNLPLQGNYDPQEISLLIMEHRIDLVVIGPEGPLESGLVDELTALPELKSVKIFGPTKQAAQLESSKAFSKGFMKRGGIATAPAVTFTKALQSEALNYLRGHHMPVVIKADGLAAGKGVIIAHSEAEAIQAVEEIFGGQFGTAGDTILIEDFLTGREFSVFIAIHEDQYILLPIAKDYKKIEEGDLGANTGGMGAVSPVPFVDEVMMERVKNEVIIPTVAQLKAENISFTGFIFFGMIEVQGKPYVIEYNARFGDPEAEVVFPRIQGDMAHAIIELMSGRSSAPAIDPRFATGIYVVSQGYPGSFQKGFPIDVIAIPTENYIFHGGTKFDSAGSLVSNGGRVLFIGAMDEDLQRARQQALKGCEALVFERKNYRSDIGYDVLP